MVRPILRSALRPTNPELAFKTHWPIVGEIAMKVRLIIWTVAMAYTGFLLTGQGLRTFNNLSITEGFLGALTGFLLAIMFTLREERRRRPAFIAYSIAQILPNWGTPPDDRGSGPKLGH
jgi:hypothetical protein